METRRTSRTSFSATLPTLFRITLSDWQFSTGLNNANRFEVPLECRDFIESRPACAEDTFISDLELAKRVAERIASKGLSGQFSHITAAKNAWELVEYLKRRAEERIGAPDVYLDPSEAVELNTMREAEAAVGATE